MLVFQEQNITGMFLIGPSMWLFWQSAVIRTVDLEVVGSNSFKDEVF